MSDTPESPRHPCPSCKGKGKTYAHLNYGRGRGEWTWVACLTCAGVGSITEDDRSRIEVGERLRARRKAARPFRTLRDEAARLGIDHVELSHAEWGRLPLGRLAEIEAMGDGGTGTTAPEGTTTP